MVDRKRDNKGRFVSTKVINAEHEFDMRTASVMLQRMQLANLAGLQFEGARDLYTVFGYEKNLKPEQLLAKYKRQDIASRIVDAPPGATWSNPPVPTEGSAGVDEFITLAKDVKLWNAMYRADRLARLNPFSLLLFGFDRGTLSSRATRADALLYVRAIGSRQVMEITYNSNPRDPRFGLPETYRIQFDDPQNKTSTGSGSTSASTRELTVHYSRVVHVAENPLEDEVFGTPILEKCYNLLDDLLKVAGGTAETYWLTGNRGMQADIDKDMELNPEDTADLADEMEEYQHQLRRVLRTRGVKLNVLDSKTPDPNNTYKMIMSLISGTTGIPARILLGSEAGQLASEQDRANWAERIEERRALYATPWILEPTIELLQNVGLLPEGDVEWEWPSAFIQNPLEQGQTMAQIARAVGNISRQTGNQSPMPLITREEARGVLGFPEDLTPEQEAELKEYMEQQEPKEEFGVGEGEGEEDEEDRDERIEDEKEDE